MEKLIKPVRIFVVFAILSAVLSIYVISMYDLQINQGEEYLEMSQNNINTPTTVVASRGSIYDRNGIMLVGNKVVNNVTLKWSVMSATGNSGAIILDLVRSAEKNNVEYIDSLPITGDAPFEYTEMTATEEKYLDKYKEYRGLDADISAVELMAFLRKTYKIDPSYNAADARSIVGIRYELDMRYAEYSLPEYIFAEDVDTNFIAVIGEKNFPGVVVEESSVREYYTSYAAHMLGTIGKINGDEKALYVEEFGYPNDAFVGKSGVEKFFETYLHGTNGTEITTTNTSGTVIGVTTQEAAEPGDDVYLSIDIDLQAVAETALQKEMTDINSTRGSREKRAEKGAAVAIDVKTGEVLAMASIPTYNLSTYYDDFDSLSEDKLKPLLNRATSEIYSPGSTFKMVTAMAALSEGKVTEYAPVGCTGSYKLGDSTFGCTRSHGPMDTRSSITKSCNFYYYTMASRMDIDVLERYAEMFGLSQSTGIELGESLGIMDGRKYRQRLYDEDPEAYVSRNETGANEETGLINWYGGMSLNAAIGQGDSRFTPLQIASYVSTIANRGIRNKLTILNRIETYDGSKTVKSLETEVLSTVEAPDEYWNAIQEGMRGVTETGTASGSKLHNYEIKVAAKTGTAQTAKTEDTNTSVFVCYAPYDDPQIAIAVVIENGGAGTRSISVAYEMLKEYFASENIDMGVSEENTLLG